MRRLKRTPQRQFALDFVERGDALTGLEWARVTARINDELPDRHVGFGKGRISRGLVAGLPGEDVVVMLALAVRAFGLVFEVLADHRRAVGHRLERIDVAGERLVFD